MINGIPWKPLKDAPRDGTNILILWEDYDKNQRLSVYKWVVDVPCGPINYTSWAYVSGKSCDPRKLINENKPAVFIPLPNENEFFDLVNGETE